MYLANLEWNNDHEEMFHLTKFTNLSFAAIVFDTGKNIAAGPVKLVQVTWGACPIHTELGRSKPYYDGDEVLHSCNLCGCPFIKEVTLELNIDNMFFEQLRKGLAGLFQNFEKKLPGWKIPKTKAMVFTSKERDVKKGQFEFHFRKPKVLSQGSSSHIPEWANITRGFKRVVRMELPSRPRRGSF